MVENMHCAEAANYRKMVLFLDVERMDIYIPYGRKQTFLAVSLPACSLGLTPLSLIY
jgi:hypothetical protein